MYTLFSAILYQSHFLCSPCDLYLPPFREASHTIQSSFFTGECNLSHPLPLLLLHTTPLHNHNTVYSVFSFHSSFPDCSPFLSPTILFRRLLSPRIILLPQFSLSNATYPFMQLKASTEFTDSDHSWLEKQSVCLARHYFFLWWVMKLRREVDGEVR